VATFDIVGMTETVGRARHRLPGREGIHVWRTTNFCEVVDPETGGLRLDGEEGELVVSTLTAKGLPLIRIPHPRPHAVLSRNAVLRPHPPAPGPVPADGPTNR